MDALGASRFFATAAKRLPVAIRNAETASLAQLYQAAVRCSQGPLQALDEKRMGHPYSRRRLRLNPNIINRWTGGFARGWKTGPPKLSGGTFTATLYNTDRKARDLEAGLVNGRPLMAPRRPHLAAYEDIRKDREARLFHAWDLVFK